MSHNLPSMDTSLTRRRVLQGTLGGAAGLVAWHQGWPRLQSAAAQKNTPSGQMTWAIHVTLAPSWLDCSMFYGSLGLGVVWIFHKKYIEKFGSDAFKHQCVGLGPYRLVSHLPGNEVVLESNKHYWCKTPHVKSLGMKSVPEACTR